MVTPSSTSKQKSTNNSSSPASSTAVVAVKKPQSTTGHTAVASEELMLTLIIAGIIPDVGLIIMGYATIPSMREIPLFNTNNPSQFFTSRLQYTCFGYNVSDLAEADKYGISGRPVVLMMGLKKS